MGQGQISPSLSVQAGPWAGPRFHWRLYRVLTYGGTKRYYAAYRKHRDTPYRFLTRIYQEGATLNTPTAVTEGAQHMFDFLSRLE